MSSHRAPKPPVSRLEVARPLSERRAKHEERHHMTATQLDSLVTLLRSRATPPDYDVGQARSRFEKTAVFLGGAPDAKCEKVDAGGVPAEWVSAPGCDTGRAILYLHGGGYAIGSLNTHRRLAYDISAT